MCQWAKGSGVHLCPVPRPQAIAQAFRQIILFGLLLSAHLVGCVLVDIHGQRHYGQAQHRGHGGYEEPPLCSKDALGIYFVPASESSSNGTLAFGGYDSSVITGPVNYVPLTATSPASMRWGIHQSISYGETPILSSTAGIVDPGTTFIFIASDE